MEQVGVTAKAGSDIPHVQVEGILGGIALPPVLLHGIQTDHGTQLMVIHLTSDRLCQWHPHDDSVALSAKRANISKTRQRWPISIFWA